MNDFGIRIDAPLSGTRRYVILPEIGLKAQDHTVGLSLTSLTPSDSKVSLGEKANNPTAKVIASAGETGIKLIESQVNSLERIQASMPGTTVIHEVFYERALCPKYRPVPSAAPMTMAMSLSTNLRVTVTNRNGDPIPNVEVIAFTNFESRQGAMATTDEEGIARLTFPIFIPTLQRLYLYTEKDYWSGLFMNVAVTGNLAVTLEPIDLAIPDILSTFYPAPTPCAGKGVRVGVIDSGVDGSHPDIKLVINKNMVTGESQNDFPPGEHGTHVGGIIGASGTRPTGMRGIAPGVELCSYRVFPAGPNTHASNFDITQAIEEAVADGCHLINMSLGGGSRDDATERAISHAWQNGVLCFVANGNDGRRPVSNPARFGACIAISAFGRPGACPAATVSRASIAPPSDATGKLTIADFSNIGPETDMTGPGVGVVSTVPGGAYAAMDGTSMACPAATGAAASLLSKNPGILEMAPDSNRALAMRQLIESSAKILGFGPEFEGHGALI